MTQADQVKKLECAMWLSQLDLQELRQGDWMNLAGELRDFVEGSGGLTDLDEATANVYGLESLQKRIGSVQAGLKDHFEKLASMGTFHVMRAGQSPTRKKLSAISFLIDGRIQVEAFEGEPYRLLTKTNTITTQAGAALVSYLVSSGIVAGQIRKCPTCGRIFLLKRKPRGDVLFHCSLKCSRLAATRRYREKKVDELKAKERERSHRRYVTKQRQKYGPKVRVERRPR